MGSFWNLHLYLQKSHVTILSTRKHKLVSIVEFIIALARNQGQWRRTQNFIKCHATRFLLWSENPFPSKNLPAITLQYLIKQLENAKITIPQYEEYAPAPARGERPLPEAGMNMNSPITDIALNILLQVSDEDLPSFCSTNKAYSRVCASNEFWRRKLAILLDYDFARIDRNYHKFYDQLKDKKMNERLIESAKNGYSDLVELLLDRDADIHAINDLALISAASEGHIEYTLGNDYTSDTLTSAKWEYLSHKWCI